jgi:DNA-binding transcriptional ArsR family regulator
MGNSSISIDIDDPRTGIVAEALANKTCVKILGLLAEKDLTASDIAVKLSIPLNTTGYNLEKLISAGLVEKSSEFFWSVKGKKTPVYRVANKRVVISPKRIIRGVAPAVLVSGIFALIIKKFSFENSSSVNYVESVKIASESLAIDAPKAMPSIAGSFSENIYSTPSWVWFFAGALFSLIVYFLWGWFSSGVKK